MAFTVGQEFKAAQANDLATEGTYTPDIGVVNSFGDDGEQEGVWHRNGSLITCSFRFVFAGSNIDVGSGAFQIDLPFDTDLSFYDTSGTHSGHIVGSGLIRDEDSTSTQQVAVVSLFGSNRCLLRLDGETFVDSSTLVWDDRHLLLGHAVYLADPAGLP